MAKLAWMTALVLLVSCDGGGGSTRCTPGTDPNPGCSIADCQAGHNACGGAVYACDGTGHVVDLGTCDPVLHDAGADTGFMTVPDASFVDAGPPCMPGSDPVPGCSLNDCINLHNECNGEVFVCDATGHVVSTGECDHPPPGDGGIVDAPPHMLDATTIDAPPHMLDATTIDAPPAP